MSKAELHAAQRTYDALVAEARDAERRSRYSDALQIARNAWNHLDEMMRFERRYEEKQFNRLPCIDIVLRLAPMMLNSAILDELSELLRKKKTIDKHASADLAAELAEAQRRLRDAHLVWSHIEANPGVRQDSLRTVLGGSQDNWRGLCERWEDMALLTRTPSGGSYLLRIVTDLSEHIVARCSMCGKLSLGIKRACLTPQRCSQCGQSAYFVMRPDIPVPEGGE